MTKLERDFQADVESIRNWYRSGGTEADYTLRLVCDLMTEYDEIFRHVYLC